MKEDKNKKIRPSKKGDLVEFIKSPTAKFGLAYNVGDKETFEAKQATILVDLGFAKKVNKKTPKKVENNPDVEENNPDVEEKK